MFGLGSLNPFANTGINSKIRDTVQTAAGVGLSLGTAGQSNKLTSKSAQESDLGKASTVAGKVATAGGVLVTGGYALAGGLASAAGTSAASTTGAATMETIAATAPAPTIFDQLKSIVSEGVATATGNAVSKATSPPPPPPTPVYGGNAGAPMIPVWGWALGGVAVTGLILFLALRK